jgi:tetratricopeptide (TPR) repeat protein
MACAPAARAQVVSLEPADGEISGTVILDPDKRPASQVAVKLKSRVAGVFRSVLTDFAGRFKIENLPHGTYDIAVDEEGYEAAETSTRLDGPSSILELHLKSKSDAIERSRYTVSVRDLKIPEKARNELKKGLERAAKGDPAGSLIHFTKATQLFPEYSEAYYNMGVAEITLGRKDEAAKHFQSAHESSGGRFVLAEFGIGYLLCLQGRPGEAEKVVRRALEVDDRAPEGHVVLADALRKLNRLDEAEKSAREALLRSPTFPGAYLILADVAENKADYHAEVQDLDVYLKLQPNGPASALARQVRENTLQKLAKIQPQNQSSRLDDIQAAQNKVQPF